MSASPNEVGRISWIDLTVPEAEKVRDFYQAVVGYTSSPVDMGGYADFNMHQPETAEVLAGVCHSQGQNAKLPPVWMVYITVANLEESLERCLALGGKVLARTNPDSGYKSAAIRDPAGAVCTLLEP